MKNWLLFSCVFIFALGLFMLICKIGNILCIYHVFKNCPHYSASYFNCGFDHSINTLVYIEVYVYPTPPIQSKGRNERIIDTKASMRDTLIVLI